MEVKYCPYCGYEIEVLNNHYYCNKCEAFFYIQVECKIGSPLLKTGVAE